MDTIRPDSDSKIESENRFNSINVRDLIEEVLKKLEEVLLEIFDRFTELTDLHSLIKAKCILYIEQCIKSITGDKNISETFALVVYVSFLKKKVT